MQAFRDKWFEIDVNRDGIGKFSLLPTIAHAHLRRIEDDSVEADAVPLEGQNFGGIIKNGDWAWLVHDCALDIVSLRNGQSITSFDFSRAKGFDNCIIKCVAKVAQYAHGSDIPMLAVCLEKLHGTSGGGSFVALYSVEHGDVLHTIEIKLHIICAHVVSAAACSHSLLNNFDGCLALGTKEGIVILLDLNLHQVLFTATGRQTTMNATSGGSRAAAFAACKINSYRLPYSDIRANIQQCRLNNVHFGIKLEVISEPCPIKSILPIDLIQGLAIGLEDGRLAVYDLEDMQIFYVTKPEDRNHSPIVKMTYVEPSDDPRPSLFLWALHENENSLDAALHTFMYDQRTVEEGGTCLFKSFRAGTMRLNMTLSSLKSSAVSCEAISKTNCNSNTDPHCLFAMTWYEIEGEKTKLLLFDINQWYKEQMPSHLVRERAKSYLARYILSGNQRPLDGVLNPASIAHFNSMQRCEEHFYPNALSFDYMLLLSDGYRSYSWEGAQNRLINQLRFCTADIFLRPAEVFADILEVSLLPQFMEQDARSTFSREAMDEVILSVALENNCFSLLRDCAKNWADGSFMGNFTASTGISLFTLTNWLWRRALAVRKHCDTLCQCLYGYIGYSLDERQQKELAFLTRQLKLLAELLSDILIYAKNNVPENAYATLQNHYKYIRLCADYHEIVIWLFNICNISPRLLNMAFNRERTLLSYPYQDLLDFYSQKRKFFANINPKFVSERTGSCHLLYIDAFIEHEFKTDALREIWLEGNGNGLYPAPTIELMLRPFLLPDVEYDSKCAVLLYFFLDLHCLMGNGEYKDIVDSLIRFPSVFKLTAALVKTVQAFWNLDHGHFLEAVDEFISPFNNNQTYPQWLLELLVESLLTQNAAEHALRMLKARPTLISPVLKLKTLLGNALIAEAFHFARTRYEDETLLEFFFKCCLSAGKFHIIRELAMSERESQLMQNILNRTKTPEAEQLQFVCLLQKNKYNEAVSIRDQIEREKQRSLDTPNMMLSAFKPTMTPVTQGLTDIYFRIQNKIKKKDAQNTSPLPLSCQLIKQNANELLGGIYHSSALSAHFATNYWDEFEQRQQQKDASKLLNCNNAPFLRKPLTEPLMGVQRGKSTISYPQIYKYCEKRTNEECELDRQEIPKKRRRLGGVEIIQEFQQLKEQQIKKTKHDKNSSPPHAQTQTKAQLNAMNADPSIIVQTPCTPKRGESAYASSIPAVRLLASAEKERRSILKSSTPEPFDRQRDEEEQRSIRFKLPTIAEDEESEDEKVNENQDNKKVDKGERINVKRDDVEAESKQGDHYPIQPSKTPPRTPRSITFTHDVTEESSNDFTMQQELISKSDLVPSSTRHRDITHDITDETSNEFTMHQELTSKSDLIPSSERHLDDIVDESSNELRIQQELTSKSDLVRSPIRHQNITHDITDESSNEYTIQEELISKSDLFPSPRRIQDITHDIPEESSYDIDSVGVDHVDETVKGDNNDDKPSDDKEKKEESVSFTDPKPRKSLFDISNVESKKAMETTVGSSGLGTADTTTELYTTALSDVPSSFFSTALPLFKIVAVESLASEFQPPLSSSKLCETRSQFTSKEEVQIRIAGHSTIISEQTTLEATATVYEKSQSYEAKPDLEVEEEDIIEETQIPQMDTTLGMTAYECNVLETTTYLRDRITAEEYDDNDQEDKKRAAEKENVEEQKSLVDSEKTESETVHFPLAPSGSANFIVLISSEDEGDGNSIERSFYAESEDEKFAVPSELETFANEEPTFSSDTTSSKSKVETGSEAVEPIVVALDLPEDVEIEMESSVVLGSSKSRLCVGIYSEAESEKPIELNSSESRLDDDLVERPIDDRNLNESAVDINDKQKDIIEIESSTGREELIDIDSFVDDIEQEKESQIESIEDKKQRIAADFDSLMKHHKERKEEHEEPHKEEQEKQELQEKSKEIKDKIGKDINALIEKKKAVNESENVEVSVVNEASSSRQSEEEGQLKCIDIVEKTVKTSLDIQKDIEDIEDIIELTMGDKEKSGVELNKIGQEKENAGKKGDPEVQQSAIALGKNEFEKLGINTDARVETTPTKVTSDEDSKGSSMHLEVTPPNRMKTLEKIKSNDNLTQASSTPKRKRASFLARPSSATSLTRETFTSSTGNTTRRSLRGGSAPIEIPGSHTNRNRRSISVLYDDVQTENAETPRKTRRSIRARTAFRDEDSTSEYGATPSTPGGRKTPLRRRSILKIDDSQPPDSPSTRTRARMRLISEGSELTEETPMLRLRSISVSSSADDGATGNNDDAASVASNESVALMKEENDDTISVASSSTRRKGKSRGSPTANLAVIPENEDETETPIIPKKRAKSQKKLEDTFNNK